MQNKFVVGKSLVSRSNLFLNCSSFYPFTITCTYKMTTNIFIIRYYKFIPTLNNRKLGIPNVNIMS